jgi:DNA-binding transcriptional regulator YiaG
VAEPRQAGTPGFSVREARQRRGLSAGDIAAHLDVHPNTVLRWERYERQPETQHVLTLARCLDHDPVDLMAHFYARSPMTATRPPLGVLGCGLRTLRHRSGVSVRQLSRHLEVPEHKIYNWESGAAHVAPEFIGPLADALGTDEAAVLSQLPIRPVRATERPHPLRQLRRRRGMSMVPFAAAMGVVRSTVRAWERGQEPKWHHIRRMSGLLGVSIPELARLWSLAAPRQLDPRTWQPGQLPEVLRTLREWSGLCQRDVARELGCSPASIRNWEAGRALPTATNRLAVERIYRLPDGSLSIVYPKDRT